MTVAISYTSSRHGSVATFIKMPQTERGERLWSSHARVYAGRIVSGHRHYWHLGRVAAASDSMAREAARRAECSNKIKQLGTALAGHESRKGRFPGLQEILSPAGVQPRVATWVVPILPDIDQQDLYSRWTDFGATPEAPYLPVLHCPSKGSPKTSIPSNSYVVNAGFGRQTTDLPLTMAAQRDAVTGPTSPYHYWKAGRKANGLFLDRVVPMAWKRGQAE